MPDTSTSSAADALDGLRMTKQRKVVYDVLLREPRDHPTAAEVFVRAKEEMPTISLATVYNCLETLTCAGAVKQVNVDREASRYCPNLQPHAHFFCSECEEVFDIDLKSGTPATSPWKLPEGSEVEQLDVTMRGLCPDCREKNERAGAAESLN